MNSFQCDIYDSSAHQRDPQKNKSHPDTFIHHLPAEILEIIFKFVLRPLAVPSHYGTLQSIASVCKQWRTVVLDSGRLWALVTIHGRTPPIATILAKSKPYPLRIADYTIGVREGDDLLFANLHRWRHAAIQLSPFDEGSHRDVQQQLWTKPAILLESARIYAAPRAHSIYQPNLFGGCAPRLHTGCFVNCWVDLAVPLYHLVAVLGLALQVLTSTSTIVLARCPAFIVGITYHLLADPYIHNLYYGWRCPNPERFLLLDCDAYHVNHAVRMLDHRYGENYEEPTGHVIATNTRPPRPVRLKELFLQGIEIPEPEDVQRLVELMPPEGGVLCKPFGALFLGDLGITTIDEELDVESWNEFDSEEE